MKRADEILKAASALSPRNSTRPGDGRDELHDRFGIEPVLRVIGVAASTYYGWLAQAANPSARRREDAELAAEIAEIHDVSGGTCGSWRVHAMLRRQGRHVGRKRVERLMRRRPAGGVPAGRALPRPPRPRGGGHRPTSQPPPVDGRRRPHLPLPRDLRHGRYRWTGSRGRHAHRRRGGCVAATTPANSSAARVVVFGLGGTNAMTPATTGGATPPAVAAQAARRRTRPGRHRRRAGRGGLPQPTRCVADLRRPDPARHCHSRAPDRRRVEVARDGARHGDEGEPEQSPCRFEQQHGEQLDRISADQGRPAGTSPSGGRRRCLRTAAWHRRL